jgi:hypothetical protein
MDKDEIIQIMSRRRNVALVPQYKAIYLLATGKPFRGCLCGSGFDNLMRACNAYAENLKKEKNNDQIIITTT